MSRSVFANTIGAFVLESDNTPKPIIRQNSFDAGALFDAAVGAGGQEAKRQVVQIVEDEFGSAAGQVAGQAVDAGLDKAGIGTSNDVIVIQPQQSSTQSTYSPFALTSTLVPTSSVAVDIWKRQQEQQRRDTLLKNISKVAPMFQTTGPLDEGQSQSTGEETSQVTETPSPKKPFFKTGAGIATILVGATAIAGGIVYFATKD